MSKLQYSKCEQCGTIVYTGCKICRDCQIKHDYAPFQEKQIMTIDKGIMSAVANEIRTQGVRLADSAAHGGSMHDGGGSISIDRAEYYLMGMNGMIPEEWKNLYQETEQWMKSEKAKKADPEYAEYLRMKIKFERM